ncbi:FAD-dependent monooxygenase [Methylobacterium terricola]|uniref:FAD-dependent monooxygenase n=1 Tax=Methylobacterium terricola TaxID=2583531 RepID=A0A5C4LTM9_9HYPH|nr:NAD(P)/FAD-dependent oxidoreductase [Methylobacterium terricola]TNC16367.1 FAD-dependent monooxygenase [Methylobacterium terricola]
MPHDIHVSIIGAGLSGLCLGQGLRRAGVRFTLFERDPTPGSRGQGYRIRLDADGQAALRHVLPDDLNALFLQSCAVASSTGRLLNVALQDVPGRPVETWRPSATRLPDEGRSTDRAANRQTLRQILTTGIEPHIRFGKSLASFDQDAQGIVCRFVDGSNSRTDILVAADGASSVIRRTVLPEAEPRDTGEVSIYGKTVLTADVVAAIGDRLTDGISVVFADTFAVIVDDIRFRAPLPQLGAALVPGCRLTPVEDYFYWSVLGSRAALGLPAGRLHLADPTDIRAHLDTLSATWHPALKALFRLSSPEVLALRPVLSAPPLTIDHRSPVAFMGDAIHVMSPAGGLGANTALRDAVAFADTIAAVAAGRSALAEALEAYHADVALRANRAIALSEDGSRRLSGCSLIDRPVPAGHG